MNASPEETEQARWMRFAIDDLAAAQVLRSATGMAPREACEKSQQSAEKAMKAVLIAEGTRVPRTHDLLRLRALQQHAIAPEIGDDDLARLTELTIESRYPGDWDEPLPADADRALRTAQIIVAAAGVRVGVRLEGAR